MAEEGACPICGFERLKTDQDNCPQCDADLTCFKVLDSIPEELAKPASEHKSSIIAIQREPSIAAREQKLPVSAMDRVSGVPAEEIALASETPSSKQESKQNSPETSPRLKNRLISKSPSLNQAAAMLTFAVILIAIVAIFQLYHLRRLQSSLQEQSRNQKIALKSEPRKNSVSPVSSELAQLNRSKADSPMIVEKVRPANGKTDMQKSKKQSEFSKPKAITAGQHDDKDKTVSLPKSFKKSASEPNALLKSGMTGTLYSDSIENHNKPKVEKKISEHDCQSITLKAGDTLKSIAETYYGSAKYYPLIIMLNPDMPVDLKNGTSTLKILKDRRQAAGLYRKHTSTIGNRLYFSYTITKDDTLKVIALKFYRSKKMIKSILDINPDSKFRIGEQIKIRLK